ncbi:MAG: hypothetical protein ACE5GD_01015 [Candidatus Geothermarchaeales archaeon]
MGQWLKYVLIGLGIRLALAPFFMHAWDVGTIQESSQQFLAGVDVYRYVAINSDLLREGTGLPFFYYGFAYPAQTLLVYAPFYWIYSRFFSDPTAIEWYNDPLRLQSFTIRYPQIYHFLFWMKLPVILCDVAVIYLLTQRNQRMGLFYALNPYVILITAIWGTWDPMVGFFLLASYLSFKERKELSGFLYGLSLMKIYTIVLLGVFVARLVKDRGGLARFLFGLSLSSTPNLYYLATSPSFVDAFLFQGTRPVNGINIYSVALFAQGVFFQTAISRVATLALAIAVVATTYVTNRRGVPMLNSLIMLTLSYFIFAPVTNEQYLASLLPLGLLSPRFNKNLYVFPLFFIALHSTYLYFATPIFWVNEPIHALWSQAHEGWKSLMATHSFSNYVRYFLSLSLAFLAFRNLLQLSCPEKQKILT